MTAQSTPAHASTPLTPSPEHMRQGASFEATRPALDWPKADLLPCVARGRHVATQRHPEADCLMGPADPDDPARPVSTSDPVSHLARQRDNLRWLQDDPIPASQVVRLLDLALVEIARLQADYDRLYSDWVQ